MSDENIEQECPECGALCLVDDGNYVAIESIPVSSTPSVPSIALAGEPVAKPNYVALARESGLQLRIDSKFGNPDYISVTGSWPALVKFAELVAAPSPSASSVPVGFVLIDKELLAQTIACNTDASAAEAKHIINTVLKTSDDEIYRAALLDEQDAAPANPAPGTPAATWREKGEPDPHGKQYECERAALTLGKLTDDELANGVFMNADQGLDIERVLARDPDYHTPIVWLTAAKERIRWLSRALLQANGATK